MPDDTPTQPLTHVEMMRRLVDEYESLASEEDPTHADRYRMDALARGVVLMVMQNLPGVIEAMRTVDEEEARLRAALRSIDPTFVLH